MDGFTDIFIDGLRVAHADNFTLEYAEKLLTFYGSMCPFSSATIVKDGVKYIYRIKKKSFLSRPVTLELLEVIDV